MNVSNKKVEYKGGYDNQMEEDNIWVVSNEWMNFNDLECFVICWGVWNFDDKVIKDFWDYSDRYFKFLAHLLNIQFHLMFLTNYLSVEVYFMFIFHELFLFNRM